MFRPFAHLVHERYQNLSKHELYVVGDERQIMAELNALSDDETTT